VKVLGFDFTSAPRPAKPITCARTTVGAGGLKVAEITPLPSWPAFEATLREPGPWVAGFDFPFGQPRRLVEALGWPQPWEALAACAGDMTARELDAALVAYRRGRPAGDRLHYRPTDRRTGALSPMMTVRVPIALMWRAGAPRLAAAGLSVLPSRPLAAAADRRVALETYPALLARALIGRTPYRAEGAAGHDARRAAARASLLRALLSPAGEDVLGLRVTLRRGVRAALLADGAGDRLDAVLAAAQAAWAWARRRRGWGIPPEADPLEGWIVGPGA
jgi:hypothetical protein